MPNVTFLPENKVITANSGDLLSEIAKTHNVDISLPCGGRGICGKCLAKIEEGDVVFTNNGVINDELEKQGYVLTCKTVVGNSDVTLTIISNLKDESGKFEDVLKNTQIKSALFPSKEDISPLVDVMEAEVFAPEMQDGLSDFDRLKKTLIAKTGVLDVKIPLEVFASLPNVLRENDGKIYLAKYIENNILYICDIFNTQKHTYGLCIDIGTTTVAVQLIDMQNGHIMASKTNYNAQIECGLDVISRISYCKNQQRIDELKSRILGTINGLIDDILTTEGINCNDVYNLSIAGNTVMIHLFYGIEPEYIRLEPYTPAVYFSPVYTAKELGIKVYPYARGYVAPNVGSYVGGDITSGILCTDFALYSEDVDLFIDIGTNGEIVMGNNEFLLSCACSAGPAFEGGGIEYGMRASVGAIETIEVDKTTGLSSFSTIGDVVPKGICGSGMISLIAQLFEHGILEPNGKFSTTFKCDAIDFSNKSARYYLTSKEKGGIYISENDIDNLIRAKAAIFSACLTMLKSVEMDFDCLSKIYVAGGFGRYLDIEKSQKIGLMPGIPTEKFVFVGNTSLTGAYMTLLSQKHRHLLDDLANKITYIDLSAEPSYMDEYVSALFLPHTDERMFNK